MCYGKGGNECEKKHKGNNERIQRFSIRKYSFGVASVALATFMMFGLNSSAQPQEASSAGIGEERPVSANGAGQRNDAEVTDFGISWNKNPMIDYSKRDVYSPDTKQYAFVSKGTADQAYDNIRVYREMRIEKNGDKYYYWMVDSGPAANAKAGLQKKITLAIPRTVGDPYDFTYTKYQNGIQKSHEEFPTASVWEDVDSMSRAYVKDGEKRPGSSYPENADAWMDFIEPSNGWQKNIYNKNSEYGTDPNTDAFPRVRDMVGIKKDGPEYNLVRGVIEDRMKVVAGQRTIITFKTKVLEGDELDQSIMSDWSNKDKSNPMLSEIKLRLTNDPYIAYGGYTTGGKIRYREGQNAIIGTLPLKPEEATNFNFQPVSKGQTTKVGVVPDAIKSIENADKLPSGTTYRWFKDPDVSKVTEPGKPVYGKVEVVIPQRGTFIVDVAVHVIGDKAETPPYKPVNPNFGRVDGPDRIETGINISKKYYDKAKTVILVRHDLFPDSMTASVLAKLKDAPILLNPTNKLDPRVATEIKRLGAEEVIIVGGPDSISEKVRGDLKAYDKDKDVERIAGVDRYGTSEMVARRVVGITGKKYTGVVASGQVFPDALSVGTFASRDGYPILLVKKDMVPVQVERAIKDLEIKKTYIAGGTNTISKLTEAKLPSVVERMAGKDRYETSVAIAKSKFKDSRDAFIASGEEFADALVISPVSGKYNRPTLLASRNKTSNALVKKYISDTRMHTITAIGGERYLPYSILLDLVGK